VKSFKFPYRYRKSLDWLFEKEKELVDKKTIFTVEHRKKMLDNIKSLKRLLEDYRNDLGLEKEKNKFLNMFIESKLRPPPNRTFVCNHCGFRGKEYRDFCPGCSKDGLGKTPKDYFIISSSDTDSDK